MNVVMPSKSFLTGGTDPEIDYPILDPKADLTAGENHAFWFFDDKGEYALLGCHIQGGGSVGAGKVVNRMGEGGYQQFTDWETRRIVYPFAGPGEELMVDFAIEPGAVRDGFEDLGGWTFKCVEPFVRWSAKYRGSPLLTTRSAALKKPVPIDGPRIPVEIDFEMRMALPPTFRGTCAEDLPTKDMGLASTGMPRYEQLYRVEGEIRIQGRRPYSFNGTGIRTHRYGKRTIQPNMFGSSWASALFPSGRGFQSTEHRVQPGVRFFSETWVTDESRIPTKARIVSGPWFDSFDCVGKKFELVIETQKGETVIEGEVLKAAYNYGMGIDHSQGALAWCHTMSRLRWDGEEVLGMTEVGSPVASLKW